MFEVSFQSGDMTSSHWNRQDVIFENYEIKQTYEFPSDIENLVMFVNNEDRSFALLENDWISTVSIVHLIVLHRDLDQYENPDLDKLIHRVEEFCTQHNVPLRIRYLNFYDNNFSVQLTEILTNEKIFNHRLVIDITSCPPQVIIPLGEVLLGHQTKTMFYAYTLPEKYDTDLIQEIDRSQVQGGIIKEYGMKHNEKDVALAIITGFEESKAKIVNKAVEPSYGYLFNYLFTKEMSELMKAKKIMKLHEDMILIEQYKQYNLDRYDLNRIFNSFLLLSTRHSDDLLVIAPFGSKIQRLATLLFVSKKTGRGIIDVIPKELSFRKISTGVDQTLFYQTRRILD